jgi:hypothetical protein
LVCQGLLLISFFLDHRIRVILLWIFLIILSYLSQWVFLFLFVFSVKVIEKRLSADRLIKLRRNIIVVSFALLCFFLLR